MVLEGGPAGDSHAPPPVDSPPEVTREKLRLMAWQFDCMKRLMLGPDAYKNFVFKS